MTDNDGGQGRDRTTDTRIFRGIADSGANRWPDAVLGYPGGYLFRFRALYSDPISPENRRRLATSLSSAGDGLRSAVIAQNRATDRADGVTP